MSLLPRTLLLSACITIGSLSFAMESSSSNEQMVKENITHISTSGRAIKFASYTGLYMALATAIYWLNVNGFSCACNR